MPPGLPPILCGRLREGLIRLTQANPGLGQAARVPDDTAGQGEIPCLFVFALRLVELVAKLFQAVFTRGGALALRESVAVSLLTGEAKAVARTGLFAYPRRQVLETRLLGAAP